MSTHEHQWSETVEKAIFTGNPYRSCTVYGCRQVTLDLDDPEDYDSEQDDWYGEPAYDEPHSRGVTGE